MVLTTRYILMVKFYPNGVKAVLKVFSYLIKVVILIRCQSGEEGYPLVTFVVLVSFEQ